MERQEVKSSSIKSFAYSVGPDRKGVMEVEFNNGRIYRYSDVPPDVAGQVQLAEVTGGSVGSAIAKLIKGKYPTEEITPKQTIYGIWFDCGNVACEPSFVDDTFFSTKEKAQAVLDKRFHGGHNGPGGPVFWSIKEITLDQETT